MAGYSHAHAFVGRRLDVTAGIAGSHGRNSLQMFENGLDAPKAASGKNGGLLALGGGQRRIDSRHGERYFGGFGRPRGKSTESGPTHKANNHHKGDAATNIRTLHGPSP